MFRLLATVTCRSRSTTVFSSPFIRPSSFVHSQFAHTYVALSRTITFSKPILSNKIEPASRFNTAGPQQQLQKMATAGDVEAQVHLALSKLQEEDYADAIPWLEKAAAQNNPASLHLLGMLYQEGKGVQINEEKAFEYFQQSSKLDFAPADVSLSRCYMNGVGVAQNTERGLELLRRAVSNGDPEAMYHTALLHLNENGPLPHDFKKAVELLNESSNMGHPPAQFQLGACFYSGVGVEQSFTESVKWFGKAAQGGDRDAMWNLALAYLDGLGIVKDATAAVKWFEKAADLGDTASLHNLGLIYLNGTGVKKDENQAFTYFQQAAVEGVVDSMYNLSTCWESGIGCEKNQMMAKTWYDRAQAAEQEEKEATSTASS